MPLSISDEIATALVTLGQLQDQLRSLKQMKSAYGFDLDDGETEKRLSDIYELTRKIDLQQMRIEMLKNQREAEKTGA